MKQNIVVTNTDRVNRKDMRFTVGALYDGLNQSFRDGVPMCLGHDRLRPLGWTIGLCLLFTTRMTRQIAATCFPDTADEHTKIMQLHRANLLEQCEKKRSGLGEALVVEVGRAVTEKADVIDAGCAALKGPGLARSRFPGPFESSDKNGLTDLRSLIDIAVAPGVFEKDGLLLFADGHFRRSGSHFNNLNGVLLGELHRLVIETDLDVRIRLDPDLLGLAKDFLPPIELDYWWGPHFNDALGEIQLGVTRHEADEAQRAYSQCSRCEFWWYDQGDERTFEVEEVRDAPTPGTSGMYSCRFAHSILDEDSRPIHVDGAIRSYSEEAMIARIEADIARTGRHAEYRKLWRVDGCLDVPTWKRLLHLFYRDNNLVEEYLEGTKREYHPEIDRVASPRGDAMCPFAVSVALRDIDDGLPTGRSVTSHSSLRIGEKILEFVEADFESLRRLLATQEAGVSWPSDTQRLDFTDSKLNLPTISHVGPDATNLVFQTRDALVGFLGDAVDVTQVSVSLFVAYESCAAVVSLIGTPDEVTRWLERDDHLPPADEGAIRAWCERIAKYFEGYPDRCSAEEDESAVMQLDEAGYLRLHRNFVDMAAVSEIHRDRQSGRMYCRMKDGDTAEGTIVEVAPCLRIERSTCARCRCQFAHCTCEGGTEIVEDVVSIGFTYLRSAMTEESDTQPAETMTDHRDGHRESGDPK